MKKTGLILIAGLLSGLGAAPAVAQPRTLGIQLFGGFQPDPYKREIYVDGTVSAENENDDECLGFIPDRPTARLDFTPGRSPLYISVTAEIDAVLVVRTPSGRIICNDDREDSLNPGITIEAPEGGTYEIWAGKYSEDEDGTDGYLEISEISFPMEPEERDELEE